jgi:hypothetical protein
LTWSNITGDQSAAGYVDYRCMYVHNGHATLTWLSTVVWVSALTLSTDDEVDIGLGTSAIGGVEQGPLGSTTTPPTSVGFSRPTTKGTALAIGDIPAGSHKAIWIRRTTDAGAQAYTNNTYAIRVDLLVLIILAILIG